MFSVTWHDNFFHDPISSEIGVASVIRTIVGSISAVLADPPLIIADANFDAGKTKPLNPDPVVAVFVTHHHPDHYFSANSILDAFPKARFYTPYIHAKSIGAARKWCIGQSRTAIDSSP